MLVENFEASGEGWVRFLTSDLPAPNSDQAITVVRLQRDILGATYHRPGEFATELVQILRSELDLVAASLYINCPELNAFKLKAADGFDYSKYKSFLLPNPSYPSVACSEPDTAVLWDTPPFDNKLYRDRSLLDENPVGGIIVVPINPFEQADPDYPLPLGALCLYPKLNGDLDRLASIGAILSPLIGTLYVAALERLLMSLREEAVGRVAFDNSLTDVSFKLLTLMKQQLLFDAGAVWLLNPRRELLYLRSAVPAVRSDGRRLMEHEIRLDEVNNPLVVAYSTNATVHHAEADTYRDPNRTYVPFSPKRILEELPGAFRNGAISPLTPAQPVTLGNQKRSALGAITILNKYSELGGVRHYSGFTWEDAKIANFMSELAAVLVFQSLRGLDHEADYERRIHGVKTNLSSVKSHLEQLEDREDISAKVSIHHQYHVSNCIEWLAEMEQQVSRSDRIERLRVSSEQVRVYGSVLAKAFQLARRSARANDVANFEIIGVDTLSSQARSIPPVYVDSRALLTVYRNLFENSLKYRDKDLEHCRVHIWYETAHIGRDRFLLLHYEDNGIGIPEGERSKVFDEGFRSRRARRVHVQGQGIGLNECTVLLEAMGGEITCEQPHIEPQGAHFVLRLPMFPPRPSPGREGKS